MYSLWSARFRDSAPLPLYKAGLKAWTSEYQ